VVKDFETLYHRYLRAIDINDMEAHNKRLRIARAKAKAKTKILELLKLSA
jgi:hypothetical protein